jgi:DNA-binding transcriptional regulator YdaS (Cro superfamily)
VREKSGVEQACDTVGGQKFLAEAVGVTPQAVSLWVAQGYVPWERVYKVAELTKVARKELCDPRLVDLLEG